MSGTQKRRPARPGLLLGLLLLVALAAGCAPGEDEVLRSFNARWDGETTDGGMMIRFRPGATGILNGLGPDGEVLGRIDVNVEEVDAGARAVRVRRTDTGSGFVLERLEPAPDGRARIRVLFPETEAPALYLVFAGPLPRADTGTAPEAEAPGADDDG